MPNSMPIDELVRELKNAKSPTGIKTLTYILGIHLEDSDAKTIFEALQTCTDAQSIIDNKTLTQIFNKLDPAFSAEASWSLADDNKASSDFHASGYDDFETWFFDTHGKEAWIENLARKHWTRLGHPDGGKAFVSTTWWGAKAEYGYSTEFDNENEKTKREMR